MKVLFCSIVIFLAVGCFGEERENDVRSYFKKLSTKKPMLSNNDVCSECKVVVTDLKNALSDPSKLDKYKFILKLVCDYLGGKEAQECKNMVDNIDVLIHQLQPLLANPELLCKEIGLCETEKIPVSSRILLILAKSTLRSVNAERNNDILCDECVFVATELKDLLSQTSIQQKLKEEIEQICNIFPSLEQQCDSIVEQYFSILVQAAEAMLGDPKQFCAEMKLCPGIQVAAMRLFKAKTSHVVPLHRVHVPTRNELKKLSFLMPLVQTTDGESAFCLICDEGVKKVIAKLNQPEIVSKLSLQTSKLFCHFFPADARTRCEDFASAYIATAISWTVNEYKPNEICASISACTNTSIAAISAMSDEERSEATCEACKVFTEFLSYEMRQQQLQDEVVEVLKSEVCIKLPGDLANQCSNTCENFVPNWMKYASDFISMPGFCNKIELC